MKKLLLPIILLPILFMGFAPVNWGLTHNNKELTPGIPKGAGEMLAQHNGIYVGDTTKKEIYLTFDLGYEAGHTGEVLDVLKEHNIKAIFFLCGNYLKETELVHRMMNEGHIIGNHTNHHRDLPTLDEAAIRRDIDDFTQKFNAQYGDAELGGIAPTPMRHFRPGKGRFDEKTLRIANELNLKTVMWSIAIVDWARTPIPVRSAVDKVMSRIHPGAIVLFHIANGSMPTIIRDLIPKIAEKGYTIGDATQL